MRKPTNTEVQAAFAMEPIAMGLFIGSTKSWYDLAPEVRFQYRILAAKMIEESVRQHIEGKP